MAIDSNQIIQRAEEKMSSAIGYLDEELARIRAGKANPRILDNVRVSYYGTMTPLANVASVNTPDAKTLLITPWEKTLIREIEKAILNSDVGITPENNGEVIRLGIPPLTEERRRRLAKQAKQEAENAKISVRNTRREVIEALKKLVKEGLSEDVERDAEEKVQKIHDKNIRKIEELYAAKEKEIMTV
jgi:ribosome recycling factor